ncbi:hypothetical protein [Pseudomonas rubra]|uniref:Uncharacterized protein n=1 Tax=Pseudomonas rubra TaxID=2942627 RepID=A0ABT5PGC4_9PSED|nr:hypothetical protein [Pseudomonas rubra]MDD1017369.1 hypothetical protein [Pseudomonas rubra]MDD1041771.1 hypothetical protein [Pseudomonas rubra]MDD1158083.1 hypothetical protein [Pseudomonas rubra]
MIPIDPFAMIVGYMIFMASAVSLWLLLACLLALLVPRCRRYMLGRPWRFGFLGVGLAVAGVPYAKIEVSHWLDWRAHNPRLEREEVLGDLVLPAGTRVRLEYLEPFNDLSGNPVPYGMHSLEQADFERTLGNIMGIGVRRLELWQHHGSATLETVAATDVQGFRCEPGKVEFHFPFGAHFRFSEWRLEGCMLAPGSELGGIVWPGPVRVFSIEGDGWEARAEDTPTQLLGLELGSLSMRLSGPHGDVLSWHGVLTRAVDFGPVHYRTGIEVRSFQGNLLFSPPAQIPALDRRTGTPIEADHSVVQSMAGEVLAVRPNHEVGVHFFDEIVIP